MSKIYEVMKYDYEHEGMILMRYAKADRVEYECHCRSRSIHRRALAMLENNKARNVMVI